MATGFIYDGAAAYATPDKGLSRGSNPSVLVARFGDGYEQRVADGINSLKENLVFPLTIEQKHLLMML